MVSTARSATALKMGACAFHDGLHATNERRRVDGLGEEGLESRIEGSLAMRRVDMCADGDGGRFATLFYGKGTDPANKRVAIVIGQGDVRQHHLGPDCGQDGETLGSRGRHFRLRTMTLEYDPHDLERVAIVVHDQYSSVQKLIAHRTSSDFQNTPKAWLIIQARLFSVGDSLKD